MFTYFWLYTWMNSAGLDRWAWFAAYKIYLLMLAHINEWCVLYESEGRGLCGVNLIRTSDLPSLDHHHLNLKPIGIIERCNPLRLRILHASYLSNAVHRPVGWTSLSRRDTFKQTHTYLGSHCVISFENWLLQTPWIDLCSIVLLPTQKARSSP